MGIGARTDERVRHATRSSVDEGIPKGRARAPARQVADPALEGVDHGAYLAWVRNMKNGCRNKNAGGHNLTNTYKVTYIHKVIYIQGYPLGGDEGGYGGGGRGR